jgi:hypothetical protein
MAVKLRSFTKDIMKASVALVPYISAVIPPAIIFKENM